MRKVAAHRILTSTQTFQQALCAIEGDHVMAIRPLQKEEAMVEWMDGTIICRTIKGNSNCLQAFYKEQLLKE